MTKTDKEVLELCKSWFEDIMERSDRLTSGNVAHGRSAIRGVAKSYAEFIAEHLKDKCIPQSLRPHKQNITNKDFEDIIREIKTRIAQCNGFNRKHREEVFSLLDSLRPQNHYKPSKEQLDMLRKFIEYFDVGRNGKEVLISLYNDLKKLTE